MNKLLVRSVVIDWPFETMEITMADNKHTLSLDTTIHVTMIGFPSEEKRTMSARELGDYIDRGYSILQISYEEEDSNAS